MSGRVVTDEVPKIGTIEGIDCPVLEVPAGIVESVDTGRVADGITDVIADNVPDLGTLELGAITLDVLGTLILVLGVGIPVLRVGIGIPVLSLGIGMLGCGIGILDLGMGIDPVTGTLVLDIRLVEGVKPTPSLPTAYDGPVLPRDVLVTVVIYRSRIIF